ncbi:hypothetical protein SALBM135S_00858 [Streptomyces alboniger]
MPDTPSAYELARIYGISAVAAMRGGTYTAKQKRALAKLAERTAKRENRR